MNLIATTPFGLEAVVEREIRGLGYEPTQVQDGRVHFRGDHSAIARCNLWLRSADRVQILVGSFTARDFSSYFDRIKDLNWSDWIPEDGRFPVTGRSVRSQLHSTPHCQSIAKKAIVESLRKKYRRFRFEESGALYQINIALQNDQVTVTIDTTGPGLHKRGYRSGNAPAPIKETLAAALVQLSVWNSERPFIDPCCGSGTLCIEAALIGLNMAPGISRSFEAEGWREVPRSVWKEARSEARDMARSSLPLPIIGTDRDRRILRRAREGARSAGVETSLHLQQKPIEELVTSREYGVVVCNPPYGERLGDRPEVESLYGVMGEKSQQYPTWSWFVITPHPKFEKCFGRKATRRRKLFNGRIACQYYQFLGPRPPRTDADPASGSDLPKASADQSNS